MLAGPESESIASAVIRLGIGTPVAAIQSHGMRGSLKQVQHRTAATVDF
jgi:hypothetical protein